jgi:hypothetical protein
MPLPASLDTSNCRELALLLTLLLLLTFTAPPTAAAVTDGSLSLRGFVIQTSCVIHSPSDTCCSVILTYALMQDGTPLITATCLGQHLASCSCYMLLACLMSDNMTT